MSRGAPLDCAQRQFLFLVFYPGLQPFGLHEGEAITLAALATLGTVDCAAGPGHEWVPRWRLFRKRVESGSQPATH